MDEFTRIALVGTSTHSAIAPIECDDFADALVTDVADTDRESSFLLRAGARAVFQSCGLRPPADVAAVNPAPAVEPSCRSRKLLGILQNAIAAESIDLYREFLQQLRTAGLLIPPELLPQSLSIRDPETRDLLVSVIGERGKWLSQFRPEWRWVADGSGLFSTDDLAALNQRWEEGAIRERCQVLQMLRRHDPNSARQRLAAMIDAEKADHRQQLIDCLEVGLSAADEDFLAARLGDRSDSVRRSAVEMLARLPDSALAKRMRERAESFFTATTRGLLRKKLQLACSPPEDIDKTWVQDGIIAKPPPGRGKRAFWTESVLSLVPPSLWCDRFNADPGALIEAVSEDPFVGAVVVGWTLAASRFSPTDHASEIWLRPLWDYWTEVRRRSGKQEHATGPDLRQTLLRAMSAADAEASVGAMFEHESSDEAVSGLAMLGLLPRPWSRSFSLVYLNAARRAVSRGSDNRPYLWAGSLGVASRALPPDALTDALETWVPKESDGHAAAVQRELDKFYEVNRTRLSFYEEIRQP